MGNYEQLKQSVADVIKTNGNQEISGEILQNALLSIISTVGGNATFAGIATPETNPGTPDQNVFYIAIENGTYSNFGSIILSEEVAILSNKGSSWVKSSTGIATLAKVTELESEVVDKRIDLDLVNGFFVNASGITTATSQPLAYSKPIKVSNGDLVRVKCLAEPTIAVVSLTDENGSTKDPVLLGLSAEELTSYEYRVEQDSYIILCIRTSKPYSCVISKDRYSSLGWSERAQIDLGSFTEDNTNFFNYKTKEYVAGNGIFYSKRIDVDAYKAIEIQSEIISSTSKLALVNFFDANNNLISFHNRYVQETLISSIIDIPTGSEYVVINYLKSRRSSLKIAGLAGTRTDDVLRQKDAESIKAESIAKSRENVLLEEYENRIYLPLLIDSRDYYNYAEKGYMAGNGSWFSMVLKLDSMTKIHYTIPSYKLTSAAISFLNFLDDAGNLLSYAGRFDALYDEKESVINVPTGATRCIVNLPAQAAKKGLSLSFVETMKDNAARVYTTPMWREKYFNDNTKILDKWYNYNTQSYEAGNRVWKSLEIDAKGCVAIKTYHQLTSSANKATLTFLDANGNYLGNALAYSVKESEPHMRMIWIPQYTDKIIITTLTYTPHDISRFWIGVAKSDNHYETMRDMVGHAAQGVCRVGKSALFVNNTSIIQDISEIQPAISIPYYDANKSQGQYERVGIQNKLQDGALNDAGGYEISFVPENDGYTRTIIGKDDNDVFFIAYTNSNRKGKIGNSINNKLETTTDFVEFKTIWVSDGMTSAMSIANIANLFVKQVRQMADGSYLIFSAYNKVAENKAYVGYFRMSRDMQQIEQVMCTDINGDYVEMNGTGTLLNDGDNHLSDCYDWHINISGKKVICSEYGDRNDLGRVFYSENAGRTFKEIFRLRNHLQDGIENEVVTQAHVHGVMIDDFDGRLFVIGGENNSNIFYSDKGLNTTDDSWTCIVIRNQLQLRHTRYTQVVNGMPFENCILFGSDNEGFGGLYRLNKVKDKKYSDLEIGFECKPYVLFTTSYCAASMQKKDANIPALMCFTRENHGLTTEQNEELNQSHYGRVVASIDGYQFAEVWKDNTYGVHEIYNESTGALENRNFAYCTREMDAYVCKNGDVYIKYAGRDFVYLGYEGYVKGYGDFSARVYKIPNGARLISL